jgi:hypothetical protein
MFATAPWRVRATALAPALFLTVLAAAPLAAQGFSVERIFGSADFGAEGIPNTRWDPRDPAGFTFVARLPDGTTDLVREDARSGERQIVVDGSALIPPGERRPIVIEGYEWAPDGERLLIHGTHDDNVHFQQSTQMVDAFIAAGEQFDFFMYPNKTHSIAGRDTQVHLYGMMLDFWRERMPPGAR